MTLPQNNRLPVSALAGNFSSTTATHKFYWFVAMSVSVAAILLPPTTTT